MFPVVHYIKQAKEAIEAQHPPGYQSGGSSHVGYASYTLGDLKLTGRKDGSFELSFNYTVTVETEFTCEPWNPPHTNNYNLTIMLDAEGKMYGKPSRIPSEDTPAWSTCKREVLANLEKKLLRVEWKYGENRAPVKFPPRFVEFNDVDKQTFLCILESDLGVDEPPMQIESDSPEELCDSVINLLREIFPVL